MGKWNKYTTEDRIESFQLQMGNESKQRKKRVMEKWITNKINIIKVKEMD